jgi:hypothetical protein
LSGRPGGCIRCSEEPVAASPLNNFEEEPVFKGLGVSVKKFAFFRTVIQYAVVAQPLHQLPPNIEPSVEIIILIIRNTEHRHAVAMQPSQSGKNIIRRKSNVMNAGAGKPGYRTRCGGVSAFRNVKRETKATIGEATVRLRTIPYGSANSQVS